MPHLPNYYIHACCIDMIIVCTYNNYTDHSCYNMEPYVTTSMDTYRTNAVEKTPLPHSALLQQNRITSIPFGNQTYIIIMIIVRL